MLYGAGLLGIIAPAVADELLARLLECEAEWKLAEVVPTLRGLRLAGFSQLPPGGDRLVEHLLCHIGHLSVNQCCSCIEALCHMVPPDDVTLQQLVMHYVGVADTSSAVGRGHIARLLREASFAD